ncbi:MAG: dihydromonapterin reductase [Alteromonadaceae bacterium]|nr:dihydromonapterin reductase [Alteromonadaceae bacterium]
MSAPIIITGAGQRLGKHAALTLNEKGYKVAITYRKYRDEFAQWQQNGIDCFAADFSDDAGVNAFIDTVKSKYASIRALVHNASSWWPDNGENDAQLFHDMMQVHAKAPYVINKALQHLFTEDKADIVHLTDLVAQTGSPKHLAYAASKAALENLTYSFARKLAPKVKVNAISPALLKFNDHDDEAYREVALTKSLLGNEPGWQESTNTLIYLLESDFVTGRVLHLDGGRHLKLP